MARQPGKLPSVLLLLSVFLGVPYYTYVKHYQLPRPNELKVNAVTGEPQLVESAMVETARVLSEQIGYRTVGTREHALGDKWMLEQVEALAKSCPARLQCETWHQVGSGSHRFDMMGEVLYKTYRNLTNIIMRVSNGTPGGKANAVLVNSHVDSTLSTPGAADDAVSAGVMLEIIRVLTNTKDWTPDHAIIFLFNNAEESLQDGSHLYSTQHETRHTVRAAINLEAAGSTGPELLFQANSEEMIQAYSHVTKPYGTVVANEIFSSGIIMSDTDFRQFVEYLNVTGLDMAIVGNSYLYHTRRDVVANIERGVPQHMAENTLEILNHLTSQDSPLTSLASGYQKPSTTFFSLLGSLFFQYSTRTAVIMHSALVAVALAIVGLSSKFRNIKSALASPCAAVVGSLLGANLLALTMDRVFDRPLSWFSNELHAVLLYAPASLAGALTASLLVPSADERTVLGGQVLLQSALALVLQTALNIGSSALMFLSGASLLAAYSLDIVLRAFSPAPTPAPKENAASKEKEKKPAKPLKGKAAAMAKRYAKKPTVAVAAEAAADGGLSAVCYAVAQVIPLVVGTEMIVGDLDVFVPLTGRIGREAPAEHIIASIVGFLGPFSLPMVLPFARRIGQATLRWVVIVLWGLSALSASVFLRKNPFDAEHQRRYFIIHNENITTGEFSLNVAVSDRAPGAAAFVADIAAEFGAKDVAPVELPMNRYRAEWDSMYPFSQFVSPYKIALPRPQGYKSPWAEKFTVTKLTEAVDLTAGSRGLTLKISHPGVIWTVLAFDAHVLEWSLSSPPANFKTRHHIKEASFYGVDEWTVDLVVRGTDPIKFSFVGIGERSMWPGKKHEPEGPAMELFEKLDAWIDTTSENSVEALLMGCVGGIIEL
ncbi:hypothetical protein AURDEDRAFT_115343 [Auricularia subglabra TFB-10046 SS5]|nr:hypothetical protein AURDEDRAFT_115343 [Auricularia subglabra TFB-10046 SS5]